MPTEHYINISCNNLTGTTNDTFTIIGEIITTYNGGDVVSITPTNASTVSIYINGGLYDTTTWGVFSTTGYNYTPTNIGTYTIQALVQTEKGGKT